MLMTLLPSGGLSPMRQTNALPAGAVEHQRGVRRKPDEHIFVDDLAHCLRRQGRKPLRAVRQFQQQHRLFVHRRKRENARGDRVIALLA